MNNQPQTGAGSESFLSRIFARKSIDAIRAEAKNSELKRTLGKWNLLSLGIGCIIGAGIFVMVGQAAAEHAGPAVILSFLITALACGFAGLCYAELASVLPVSGSAYTYAYATLGEFLAWIMGCFLILEYGLAAATVAAGWSGYLTSLLSVNLGIELSPILTKATGTEVTLADGTVTKSLINLPAFLGVIAITGFLIKGVKESVTLNNVIVGVKLAVIVGFIIFGAFHVQPENWTPFIPKNEGPGQFGTEGVLRAASIIFFAYIGFEAVSTAAAEAKNPQKDMPFGMIGSLAVCTILYMALAAVLTGVVPYQKLNVAEPLALAADYMGVKWFSVVIKIGALLGLTSVMLVLLYAQTRIFYMMSKDGLLPSFMSKIHPKTQTPHINTAIVGLIAATAAGTISLANLGNLVSLGTLLAFMIVCGSVLFLHYTRKDLERPYNTPFKPLIPILGIAACGYLASTIPPATFWHLKYYLLGSLLIYIFYGYRNSKMRKHA